MKSYQEKKKICSDRDNTKYLMSMLFRINSRI